MMERSDAPRSRFIDVHCILIVLYKRRQSTEPPRNQGPLGPSHALAGLAEQGKGGTTISTLDFPLAADPTGQDGGKWSPGSQVGCVKESRTY